MSRESCESAYYTTKRPIDRHLTHAHLSPHVNTAARLEMATKQLGTAILLSDSLYSLLSDDTRRLCRLVDRVTVKGEGGAKHVERERVRDRWRQGEGEG